VTSTVGTHSTERIRTVAGLVALVGVLVVFVIEPFHGSVLLSLAGSHGLDLGDVAALPFALAALWLLRGTGCHRWAIRTLDAVEQRGWDPMAIGLLAGGSGMVLVQVFRELDLSGIVPHIGVVPATLAAAGLTVAALALVEPGCADETFGVPLAVVVGLLGIGLLIDATDGPAGSVVGPTLMAALFTITLGRRRPAARWSLGLLTLLFILVDLSALVDLRFLEADRELDGGGLMRTGALGLVLLVVGVLRRSQQARRPGRNQSFQSVRE
jgi:hypothetical protein